MKSIFFGTPAFALPTLKNLNDEHELLCVVTQPDKPAGRKLRLAASPVKMTAISLDRPVLEPEILSDKVFQQALLDMSPDIIVVAAYGKIIPRSILDIPKYGCINIHASLLPKYRGAAPIQRAIMDGETETGVTIMQMDEGLDTGDILKQQSIGIGDQDGAGEVMARLADLGAELVIETLEELETGKSTPVAQNDREASNAPPVAKEEWLIDWRKSARELSNLIRAAHPAPGAYTFWKGRRLKIKRAAVSEGTESAPAVVNAREQGISIGTGRDSLRIIEIQPEGKKTMTGPDFLRGYQIKSGDMLDIVEET